MVNNNMLSVQEEYAKKSICYGCGPANQKGLRIESFRTENGLDLWFDPMPEHQAFPGVINGGIIGCLFDCHGNWTAAVSIYDKFNLKTFPSTVTANFSVNLLRPTPYGKMLHCTGRILTLTKNKAEVEVDLFSEDKHCAKGNGLFVVVKKGHPAYHRW